MDGSSVLFVDVEVKELILVGTDVVALAWAVVEKAIVEVKDNVVIKAWVPVDGPSVVSAVEELVLVPNDVVGSLPAVVVGIEVDDEVSVLEVVETVVVWAAVLVIPIEEVEANVVVKASVLVDGSSVFSVYVEV